MKYSRAMYRVIGFVGSILIGFMGIATRSLFGGITVPAPVFVVTLLAAGLGLVGVVVSVWRPRIGGSLMIGTVLPVMMLFVFPVVVLI